MAQRGIYAQLGNRARDRRAVGRRAQARDVKFVPVNTSQNLAAPVPMYYGPQVQKKNMLGRLGDSLRSLSPFSTKKVLPTPPTPAMPTSAPVKNLLGKAADKAAALMSTTKGVTGVVK